MSLATSDGTLELAGGSCHPVLPTYVAPQSLEDVPQKNPKSSPPEQQRLPDKRRDHGGGLPPVEARPFEIRPLPVQMMIFDFEDVGVAPSLRRFFVFSKVFFFQYCKDKKKEFTDLDDFGGQGFPFQPFSIHLVAAKHRPQTAPVDKMQSKTTTLQWSPRKYAWSVCCTCFKGLFPIPVEFSHFTSQEMCKAQRFLLPLQKLKRRRP